MLSLTLRRQISRTRRRILPVLCMVLRALVYRFERALASCNRRSLLALPSAPSRTLAFARRRRRTKNVHIFLMELARRTA
jgi:hypothetical protein